MNASSAPGSSPWADKTSLSGLHLSLLAAILLATVLFTTNNKQIASVRAKVLSHASSAWSSLSSSSSKTPPPKTSKWADVTPWPAPDSLPEVTVANLSTVQEPKYRPFKFGPTYSINMGIRSLDPRQWLAIHSSYPSYAVLRSTRHKVYGETSCKILPGPPIDGTKPTLSATNPNVDGHRLAALEVARSIAWYLGNKYPSIFSVQPEGALARNDDGWSIRSITRQALPSTNMPTQTWNLMDEYEAQVFRTETASEPNCPMKVAGELVPDDLAIMFPEPAGPEAPSVETEYRFVAGSICTAGFWRMVDKLGMTLSQIHTSGNVPQYNTRLRNPMERFFSKLHPNKPVERNNYFFQVLSTKEPERIMELFFKGQLIPDILDDDGPEAVALRGSKSSSTILPTKKNGPTELYDQTELSWSHSTNGPEKLYDMVSKGPHAEYLSSIASSTPTNEVAGELAFTPPTPTQDPGRVVMRTERQTLRRFPRSNAILFTIRTYLVPVTQMAQEPGVPVRLASAIRSWPDDVQFYKGAELYKESILPYLDAKAEEQRQQGIVDPELTQESLLEQSRKSFPF